MRWRHQPGFDPQGDRTSYGYDSAGRPMQAFVNGTRASFSYDAAGNLTKVYNLKCTGAVVSSCYYKTTKSETDGRAGSGGRRVTRPGTGC